MYLHLSDSYKDTTLTKFDVFTVIWLDIGWIIQPESVGLIVLLIVLVT